MQCVKVTPVVYWSCLLSLNETHCDSVAKALGPGGIRLTFRHQSETRKHKDLLCDTTAE